MKRLARDPWRRCPSYWIHDRGLRDFSAAGGQAAGNTAALMCLTKIAHEAEQAEGVARVTYDVFQEALGRRSRALVARGLDGLKDRGLIEVVGRSTYAIDRFDPTKGWAKFPHGSLYVGDTIEAFDEMRLRRRVELDALKLFFLFAALRDNNTNSANASYETIMDYTGISRGYIKPAISLLATHHLVLAEPAPSSVSEHGISMRYRLRGIDPHRHPGTIGRSEVDVPTPQA